MAYDKAKILLQKNHLVLEKIVEELIEYEILTGKVCIQLLWWSLSNSETSVHNYTRTGF